MEGGGLCAVQGGQRVGAAGRQTDSPVPGGHGVHAHTSERCLRWAGFSASPSAVPWVPAQQGGWGHPSPEAMYPARAMGTRLRTQCSPGVSLWHVAEELERGCHTFPVACRSGWMLPVLFICLMRVGSAALTANGAFPICHGWLSPQPGTGPGSHRSVPDRGAPRALPALTRCSPSSLALMRQC